MKYIFSILAFCLSIATTGQTLMNRDSLLSLLPTAQDDSNKVNLLIEIGQQYEFTDFENAKAYYLKAKELSEKLHYKKGIVKFIANYTYILGIQGKLDSSMLLNKKGAELAKEIDDQLLLGKMLVNVGNSFYNMDQYDSAIYYYIEGRRYIEPFNNDHSIATISNLLQSTYMKLAHYKNALTHGESAVATFRKLGDSVSLSRTLSNLGNNLVSLHRRKEALDIFHEALYIAEKIEFVETQQAILLNIANAYIHDNISDSLKYYYEKALHLSESLGDKLGLTVSNRGMSIYYKYEKDFLTAKKYADEALRISRENNLRKETAENLQNLGSILYGLHEVKLAENALGESTAIMDSIKGDEVSDKIITLEKIYETEKKEAQIELQQASLKQKNILNYILIGGTIALLTILGLSYKNYHNRQQLQQAKIDELETEKKLTAAASVLRGEEQERTRLAKDLHDGLGGMLSGIKYSFQAIKGNMVMTPQNHQNFERSMDMLDGSIKEMRRVAHNMMPEALVKFGLDTAMKDFCNDINESSAVKINYQSTGLNDSSIDQTTAITIYRIVQELLNNIIRHAGATAAIVQIDRSDGRFSITVEDDGRGFDTRILQTAKGMGWNNIQSRVEFLKGKLNVQSNEKNGTSVFIEFET